MLLRVTLQFLLRVNTAVLAASETAHRGRFRLQLMKCPVKEVRTSKIPPHGTTEGSRKHRESQLKRREKARCRVVVVAEPRRRDAQSVKRLTAASSCAPQGPLGTHEVELSKNQLAKRSLYREGWPNFDSLPSQWLDQDFLMTFRELDPYDRPPDAEYRSIWSGGMGTAGFRPRQSAWSSSSENVPSSVEASTVVRSRQTDAAARPRKSSPSHPR